MAGAVDDLGGQVLLRANKGVGAALRLRNERQQRRLARRALRRLADPVLLLREKGVL